MLARFFIDRPIFAWVLSIVIVLAGAICNYILPIARTRDRAADRAGHLRLPRRAPRWCRTPSLAPIEQQVVGVENALYMASQSASDGSYTLTVTFSLGTDLNMAQVLVQNRVAQRCRCCRTSSSRPASRPRRSPPTFSWRSPSSQRTTPRRRSRTLRAALHQQLRHDPGPRRGWLGWKGGGRHDPGAAGLQQLRVWLNPDQLATPRP